ncbi:MAG: DNA primase [Alphaproteobacteria bacterium]|nr:DNA primase [Alphaproteobacteria bacterium]
MSLKPEFLDEIRDRVSLSSVVGRRVRLIRKGREHSGLCPFHNEKTPSFTVSDDKGFFHCFGCGAHGDVIGFVMKSEGLGFRETVERLAAEAGLQMPVERPEEREREQRQATLGEVVELATKFYEQQLRQPSGRAALDYLKGRGVAEATIARFRLGYAPASSGALKAALAKADVPEERMIAAGLLKKPEDGRDAFDYLRDRVVFPIFDRRGRPIAFGGRTMSADGGPKYLNSPETELFHKGRGLYGLHLAREAAHKTGEVIVVEGYMDVIALAEAGFAHAVAPLGTALTEDQIQELWKLAPEPILCFDGDAAGQRAAARAADRALPLLAPGRSVRFVQLPAGEDPDSLVRKRGGQALREVLATAQPLIRQIWEIELAARPIDTPERRADFYERLRQRLGRIADQSIRDFYRQGFDEAKRQTFPQPEPSRPWALREGGFRGFRQGPPVLRPPPGGRAAMVSWDQEQAARREGAKVLATLLTHPGLLSEVAESLGYVIFPGAAEERLKVALAMIPQDLALDARTVRLHLNQLGFAETVDRLLSDEVLQSAPFARPGASIEVARERVQRFLDRAAIPEIEAQLAEAERELLVHMTDEAWAKVDSLRQSLSRIKPRVAGAEAADA